MSRDSSIPREHDTTSEHPGRLNCSLTLRSRSTCIEKCWHFQDLAICGCLKPPTRSRHLHVACCGLCPNTDAIRCKAVSTCSACQPSLVFARSRLSPILRAPAFWLPCQSPAVDNKLEPPHPHSPARTWSSSGATTLQPPSSVRWPQPGAWLHSHPQIIPSRCASTAATTTKLYCCHVPYLDWLPTTQKMPCHIHTRLHV